MVLVSNMNSFFDNALARLKELGDEPSEEGTGFVLRLAAATFPGDKVESALVILDEKRLQLLMSESGRSICVVQGSAKKGQHVCMVGSCSCESYVQSARKDMNFQVLQNSSMHLIFLVTVFFSISANICWRSSWLHF